MMRLGVIVLCASMAACATVETDATTALDELAKAKTVVGIAEGIAGVAVLADPALAVIVNPIVAVINAAESSDTATASGTVNAAAISREAATLEANAIALENATSQAVTVKPNSVASFRRADDDYQHSLNGKPDT